MHHIPTSRHGSTQNEIFDVDALLSFPTSNWDKRIASDLIAEMEVHLSERVRTLPEMRRILAVKGYAGLRGRIERDIEGMHGPAALRAMADAMRDYALEHPGLSAATFRTAATDSPEWRQALFDVSQIVFGVFAEIGLVGEPAQHALRVLRSLIRGFVISQMAASFVEPLDHGASFQLAIDAFILGLPAFGAPIDGSPCKGDRIRSCAPDQTIDGLH
jgi:Tetracyclin repressor-like, C-terminal domain